MLLFTVFGANAQTKFFEGNLTEAMKRASAEQKYLFVDCYTDWCGWCKVADEKTFPNEEVGAFLSDRFINVKVDMERGEGVYLGAKYRVFGYPTYLIFTPDGNFVSKLSGFQSNNGKFITKIEKAMVDSVHPDYPSKIFDKVDFPDFYLNSFTRKDEDYKRSNPTRLEVQSWLNSQSSLFSESAWSVICKFGVIGTFESKFLSAIDTYKKIYGVADVEEQLSNIAYSKVKEAVTENSVAKLNSALEFVRKHFTTDIAERVNYYSLFYLEETSSWKEYMALVQKLVDENDTKKQIEVMNNYCWTIYERIDDPAAVELATQWMENLVDQDTEYMFLDTYAALLYKSKRHKEAEKWALLALEKGKNSGADVSETSTLLTKIKAELKGK